MNVKTIFFSFISLTVLFTSCTEKKDDYDASGVFEVTEVIVSAKGAGEIERLNIREGAKVTADVPLGYIDTTQLVLQRKQLRASISATDSRQLNGDRQLASLRQQLANMRSEQQRFQDLVNDNAAPRKQLDDINYQIEVIQKQISATQEQIESANNSTRGQSTGIAAQIEQINAKISDCTISSPITGTVLSKFAEEGEYASPGKPLFKVGDVSRMRLRAYITASQLNGLKIGDKVKVYADQGETGRKEYSGTVAWISDEAEFTPKTIQTRDERSNLVYAIKIDVDNHDGMIKRGMYGDVKF